MTYANSIAIGRANAIGLRLSEADWRSIFLAITDEIASDPPAAQNVSAGFVCVARDGAERWRIVMPGREFDVIYDPGIARIVLVIRPRDPDAQPAVVPKPSSPLKGKTPEKALENV